MSEDAILMIIGIILIAGQITGIVFTFDRTLGSRGRRIAVGIVLIMFTICALINAGSL